MPTGTPTKMKPCKICGELFLPDKPSSKYCSKDHHTSCPICGRDMIGNSTRAIEPCSKQCRKELTRRNNIIKYGVEHPMQSKEVQEHHRQSMLDKYGVESPLQSDEIKQRAIATNREKFGVDWALSNNSVKEKASETMIGKYGAPTTLQSSILKEKMQSTMVDKYGAPTPMEVDSIKEKVASTNLEEYGVSNPMQNPDILQKAKDTRSQHVLEIWEKSKKTWMKTLGVENPSFSQEVIDKMTDTFMKRYGVKRAIQIPEFKEKMERTMIERYGVPYYHTTEEFKNSQHFRVSQVNKRIASILQDKGIESQFEFVLGRKSYDLYLPQQNTLIEVDPTYTHNVIGNHWNKDGLPVDYHLQKTLTALEYGYRCIHLFDWDDVDKIVNMLSPKKKIFARKCTIFRIWPKYSVPFLNEFHLQGSCSGQLLHLGLVLDDVLYMVMTFGKSRYDTSHDVELLRLCTRSGYAVIGGASRLFKYATLNYGLENIISYCDRSKFSGTVYEEIGMRHIRDTPPQEVWSKENKKITANLLRQRGFDQLFNTSYGKGTSNEQLMLEDGWLPVYDCGQSVFEY